MSETVIRVEGLGKRYAIGERQRYLALRDVLTRAIKAPLRVWRRPPREHIWALKDVSFEVKQGEVVGIIGRNGAGKTTLLKLLSRITRPTEGFTEVRGRIGSLLEVGTGFHPELTGRENTFLSGAILGMSKEKIRCKFDEIVAFAEVERFIDTPLKHYSSGMEMRLAFAVAAHLEPEILLVDEVLAVGDAAFQKKCLGKMGEVARVGRTILFVTHNMVAIQSISRRCILVDQGRVTRDGEPSAIIKCYLTQGVDSIPSDIDTSNRKRPDGLAKDLRVTRVRLLTDDGYARLLSRAPLALELELEVVRRVAGVSVGFSVYSAEGIRLFQCHNTNEGSPYSCLEPGRYRIRGVLQDLALPPGRYQLDVGVRCESKGLDWLQNLMFFEVGENAIPESTWFKAQDGLFRQSSRWEPPERIEQFELCHPSAGREETTR